MELCNSICQLNSAKTAIRSAQYIRLVRKLTVYKRFSTEVCLYASNICKHSVSAIGQSNARNRPSGWNSTERQTDVEYDCHLCEEKINC